MLSIDLSGKRAFVAGVADDGGFGFAIAKALADSGVAEKVERKHCIIPGGVAAISGKLEEESGWEVTVGPRESAGIPAFMREEWRQSEPVASSRTSGLTCFTRT